MSFRINSNIQAIQSYNQLATTSVNLGKSFRRLSTGLRIATAADDPAGLAMSERLRARTRSLEQAQRNSNDGISLVQTAEGALSEVSDTLVRMRELSVQANNGTVSDADRDTLQQEFDGLRAEIDRIAQSTEFGGISMLDGSLASLDLQVGAGTTAGVDTMTVNLTATQASDLSIDALDIGSAGNPSSAINALDAAIDTVSATRGEFGSVQNRLESSIRNLGTQVENLMAAESRIRDVDVAKEIANQSRNQVLQQVGIAMLGQANVQPQLALGLLG